MRSRIPGSPVSRRGFMRTGLGVGAALLLPELPGSVAVGETAPAHDHEPAGDAKRQPTSRPERPSSSRRSAVPPMASSTPRCACDTPTRILAATGSICGPTKAPSPGPTLRLKPGDVLRIKLINDMPPNRDPAPVDHSLPHDFNTTNLHSHGLHVSPSGISDNVMRIMEPGESYDIEIAIPSDHIPGTNWYHPHAHGSADVQIASGAVGALIIEGDFADVPEIAAAKERLLVLTEAVFDRFGMVEDFGNAVPGNRRALLRREWRARTDHHHAARRGAALAHPACGLAGRPVPGLGRAHAEFDRPRRHPAVAHGPERSDASPISPPTIRMPC